MGNRPNNKNNTGFSLIELIIVMAIVAILALLLVIAIGIAMRNARNSKLVGDAKTMKNALIAFSQTNNGEAPWASLSSGGAIQAYDLVLDPAPSTDKIYRTLADYTANPGNVNGIMANSIPDSANFVDSSPTDGGYLCYLHNSTWCQAGFCLWVVPDGVTISGQNKCAQTLVWIRNNMPQYWFSVEGSN